MEIPRRERRQSICFHLHSQKYSMAQKPRYPRNKVKNTFCLSKCQVLANIKFHGSSEISAKSRILFVNDGSKDSTWDIICKLAQEDEHYIGISQSRNRGHQNALLGGLMTAKEYADMTISLDADLQDDINAVDRMIDAYYEGNDVVYGVRSSRKKDTCFKRGTAHLFYKLMSFLGADIVYDHADYRLLSKRATENLLDFDEVNLFLRGIVPMVGFQSTTVEYERGERFAGESKYPLGKMVTFAFEGITSLSVKPIRMITIGGLLICLISLIMLIKSFVDYFNGNVVPGWASIMVSIWVLGGLQIFAIGIIGEYIGKTYLETKKRPKYIIESVILDDKDISIDRNL